MKLVTWNVNGIRAVWKKGFWEWVTKTDPDILCLQEIKALESQIPQSLLETNKYFLSVNSAKKPGYAGVAVYSKEKPLEVNRILGNARFDSEGRFLELKFKKFTLINLYLPRGGRKKKNLSYKLEVYKRLLDYVKRLGNKNVILAGDFNIAHKEIDLARPKQNMDNIMFTPQERKQIDALLDLNFLDSFRIFNRSGDNYTWLSYRHNAQEKNLGWRIDYIFTSKNLRKNLESAFILPVVCGSDHCPSGIKLVI